MPSTAKQLDLLAEHNGPLDGARADQNAWGQGVQLFDAPPPVRPSAEQLESIYGTDSDRGRPATRPEKTHHPDEPGFNILEYYNKYNEKYKCPMCP